MERQSGQQQQGGQRNSPQQRVIKNENGKTFIVITGCSKGLGYALTQWFYLHRKDHNIILAGCSKNVEKLSMLQKEMPDFHFMKCDVSKDEEVKRWAQEVCKTVGQNGRLLIDFLVNCAGTMHPVEPLWKQTDADFTRLTDVHLRGIANIIRHFVPAMVERKHGMILNFSSNWGRSAEENLAPYCATKWGIEGLTKCLAMELPNGMGAIPISPGKVRTEVSEQLQRAEGESAQGFKSPEEWACEVGPWFLSLTPQCNGKSLTVPGGEDVHPVVEKGKQQLRGEKAGMMSEGMQQTGGTATTGGRRREE